MTFKKTALTTRAHVIFNIVMTIMSAALFRFIGMWIFFCTVVMFIVAVIADPIQNNELITIDENGISCEKSGKQIWMYKWDEIAKLERSNRFQRPSVEIVTWDDPYQPARSDHYFELCKPAKEALKQYYKQTSSIDEAEK